MTARTWIGGGGNRASDQNGWTPTGAPQQGDTLAIGGYGLNNSLGYTMNVYGNDLANGPVQIGTPVIAYMHTTVNMAQHADMMARVWNTAATFNMTQNSNLNLIVDSGAHVGVATAVINLSGRENLTLTNNDSQVAVNMSPGAKWTGTLTMGFFGQPVHGHTIVNGGDHATFTNKGASTIEWDNTATINARILGNGSFDVASTYTAVRPKLEFMQSVSYYQSVSDAGLLQIDRPDKFYAAVTLKSALAGSALPAEIDLMGLATADSYSYSRDMLNIFSGASVIETTLRLHDATTYGFTVQKGAGSLNIIAITDPTNIPAGLPVHVGS